jgi:hypothetical protein
MGEDRRQANPSRLGVDRRRLNDCDFAAAKGFVHDVEAGR